MTISARDISEGESLARALDWYFSVGSAPRKRAAAATGLREVACVGEECPKERIRTTLELCERRVAPGSKSEEQWSQVPRIAGDGKK